MKQQWLAVLAFIAMGFSGWFASTAHGNAPSPISSQADEFPDWLKSSGTLLGLIAGPGIAVWYLWYDTTRVKPKLQRDFREQLESMVTKNIDQQQAMEKRHADHWTILNNQYHTTQHEMLKDFREDLAGLRASLDRLSEALSRNSCRFEPPRVVG